VLDVAEQVAGLAGEEDAGVGEADAPAVAFDEVLADLALEAGELLGDR
jgi:hypothetical protein